MRQSKLAPASLSHNVNTLVQELEASGYVCARLSYLEMMMTAEGEFVLTNTQLSNIFTVVNALCDDTLRVSALSEESIVDWFYLFYGAFCYNHPAGSCCDVTFGRYVVELCSQLAEDGSAGPVQCSLYTLVTDQIAFRA
jgi:hypothetical protein